MKVPRTIAALAPHCDVESSRYSLNGIQFERDHAGNPHAVATDGRRLVHATWHEPTGDIADVDGTPVNGFSALLPHAAVTEIAKQCKAKKAQRKLYPKLDTFTIEEPTANGEVKLAVANRDERAVQSTKIIEGKYPRWRDVFPSKPETKLNLKPNQTAEQFAYSEYERQFPGSPHPEAEDAYYAGLEALYAYVREGSIKVSVDAKYLAEVCQTLNTVAHQDETPDTNGRIIKLTIPLDAFSGGERPILAEKRGDDGTKVEALLMPCSGGR